MSIRWRHCVGVHSASVASQTWRILHKEGGSATAIWAEDQGVARRTRPDSRRCGRPHWSLSHLHESNGIRSGESDLDHAVQGRRGVWSGRCDLAGESVRLAACTCEVHAATDVPRASHQIGEARSVDSSDRIKAVVIDTVRLGCPSRVSFDTREFDSIIWLRACPVVSWRFPP